MSEMKADFHLPVTPKQIAFAQALALRNAVILPWDVQQDRTRLSQWIDAQANAATTTSNLPSSKQVAFAERIARIKRISVPDEAFRDRGLMSRWITSHKR